MTAVAMRGTVIFGVVGCASLSSPSRLEQKHVVDAFIVYLVMAHI